MRIIYIAINITVLIMNTIINEGIWTLDDYPENKQVHGRNINKQIIKTEQARHMTESLGTQLELLSFLSIII
jgi:hypothetical protein